MTTISFAKGHGTRNDFVLVPDTDGALNLTDARVAYLCDRRSGIGADGIIRVVKAGKVADAPADTDPDLWFMDYRNADGSTAEMCGNGTRVFAEYLRTRGLVDEDVFDIGTRAGVKRITAVDGGFAVDLGTWQLARPDEAAERGMDSVVQVHGAPSPLPALSIDLDNPHTVVALPPNVSLEALDLTTAPQVDPLPAHGTNVEFVRPLEHTHVAMRVHERGVGETQSCGTGAVAAALATWWWGGQPTDRLDWQVNVPGGQLGVHIQGGRVALSGPAVIVAEGTTQIPD